MIMLSLDQCVAAILLPLQLQTVARKLHVYFPDTCGNRYMRMTTSNPTQHKCQSSVRRLHASCRWVIKDFSACFEVAGNSPFISSPFGVQQDTSLNWRMMISREDRNTTASGYRFHLARSHEPRDLRKVQAILCVLAADGREAFKQTSQNVPDSETGKIDFGLLRDIAIDSKELLLNNSMTILCQIEVTEVFHQTFSLDNREVNPLPSTSIERFFNSTTLSDVIFVAGGIEFHAHKVLVAAKSPVCEAMLTNPMKEQQTNRIEMSENAETFEEILRFIYSGKLEDLPLLAHDLLVAADKYEIQELKMICQQQLSQQLNEESAPRLLVLADLHNAAILKCAAIKYINANASNVAATKGWKELIASYPKLVAEVCESLMNN